MQDSSNFEISISARVTPRVIEFRPSNRQTSELI